VQTRGGRSVLFAVAGGKAKMVPVKIGRQMEGWREVLDGLSPGAAVVSMGQTLVDDGTPVSIVKEDAQ
jgi:multidrug efflux pump subunit AcrA (membrane-fusion protein)